MVGYLFNNDDTITQSLLIEMGLSNPKWNVLRDRDMQIAVQADDAALQATREKMKGGAGAKQSKCAKSATAQSPLPLNRNLAPELEVV